MLGCHLVSSGLRRFPTNIKISDRNSFERCHDHIKQEWNTWKLVNKPQQMVREGNNYSIAASLTEIP